LFDRALRTVRDVVAGGGRVLFVGTKKAAADYVAEAATRCGQYYVNHRWLGGMLTNWKTITGSIKRLKQMDEQLAGNTQGLTKKEILMLTREREKLDRALGGIREMGGLPDLIFVIDTIKEKLAIEEANKLGIPVIAVCDSNADPSGVAFPIPGNDDAIRAINLYCDMMAAAVFDGISAELSASGVDVGAQADLPADVLPDDSDALPSVPQDVSSTGGVGIFAESVPDTLGGERVSAGPSLPTAQTSPNAGVDHETMETIVQNNRDDGNRAG
jgi:small subunit ribosomal protein S2